MVKLNSGWRHWDKHLSKFTELAEPIHAMEIGSYEGDATVWLLNNLCSKNVKSSVYCLDTWTGSPEYVNINFMDIEKTGHSSQVKKIKGLSYGSLVKLLAQEILPEFHVIFIDASHEARDVLADAVLAWPLLKRGGILIFDDYKWTKLSPDYFRPKPAIDA